MIFLFVLFAATDAQSEIPANSSAQQVIGRRTTGWKFTTVMQNDESYRKVGFDDALWKDLTTPLGYDLANTSLPFPMNVTDLKANRYFYIRREFTLSDAQFASGGSSYVLRSASDDFANIWVNNYAVTQEDYGKNDLPGNGHNYRYWNKQDEVPPSVLVLGKNVVAAEVRNGLPSQTEPSSDLYFDAELDFVTGGTTNTPAPVKCTGCCMLRGEGCLCGFNGYQCSGNNLVCTMDKSRGDMYCFQNTASSSINLSIVVSLLATLSTLALTTTAS